MRHRRLALLIFLVLGLLGVAVGTPASAQTTPTADVTSATVVLRGAAVDLTATVTCEAGYSAALSLTITERSGNGIASGTGWTRFDCTGEPQTVTVRATAEVGGAPFRVGDALVTGTLEVWDAYSYQTITVNDTVHIRM